MPWPQFAYAMRLIRKRHDRNDDERNDTQRSEQPETEVCACGGQREVDSSLTARHAKNCPVANALLDV